ncbi:MAG: hypothetical protein LC637_11415 [Xanthomonadaceae bacterium]|nr:hypothetical protein [Xanthomonadaceae bacterium]
MKFLMMALFALIFSGCASVERPVAAKSREHVVERNYLLGQTKTAHVGDAMVRVKDYWVTRTNNPAVTPTSAVTINPTGWDGPVTYSPGMLFPVEGEVTLGGEKYTIVRFAEFGDNGRLIIDSDGRLDGRFLNLYNRPVPMFKHDVEPSNTRFERTVQQEVERDVTFLNFELIYSGSSGGSINVLYREYTPDDLIRPAFSQTASYDVGSQTIRFRGMLIEVHDVDGASIRYAVMEDGL